MNIQDIISWAKEFMLKDGGHRPTLFVETDKPQMIFADVADMPPPAQRLAHFIELGRKMGQEHAGENLTEVAIVVMAWGSRQLPGQPAPKVRPSQDPKRMEVFMITNMRFVGEKIERGGEIYEILRDGKGKVVDLLKMQGVGQPQDNLLAGFAAGFKSAIYTEEQIIQMIRDQKGPA